MRSLRYLNTILTVLTVLLALQLWTTWSTPAASSPRGMGVGVENGPALPTLVSPVMAQSGGGIPDAGAQRKEMIDLLKRQLQQSEELMSLLKSGQVRVRVEAGK